MVENFADPEVGYVTGTLRYSGDGASLGEAPTCAMKTDCGRRKRVSVP